MRVEPEVDAARRRLGILGATPIGAGGEAVVYALDRERVARIHRPGTPLETVEARAGLLAELAPQAQRVPFALPSVLETHVVDECVVCIEPRLAGEALLTTLERERGSRRETLVRRYLDAARAIGALDVARPDCRDLCRSDAVSGPTPGAWARARLTASLEAAGPDFAHLDGASLADDLPEPHPPALAHLDAFPGNMLVEGSRITAVIDFGAASARTDPQLDPLLAAVYLQHPMTPSATAGDRALALAWLQAHGLAPAYAAAERFAAAYWCWAADDAPLHAWCRRVLLA